MQNELLKVMVVDDERLVRDLLKACIEWEEIGLSIVGESSSAVDALELVDNLMPDIIFTDICMPIMDGLEFSKRVVEKHPHIKMIILTGHEEFEYAKKGIKVGIADFLLKPINDDEIRKTALATKEKILKERTQIEEYDRLKEQLRQNLPVLKEKLFNELIQSSIDIDYIQEKIKYFEIETKEDAYQTAVVEVFNAKEDESADEEKKLLLKIRCLELTQQYFEQDRYIHVFFDNSQRIVIFCNDSTIDLWECCEAIKSMLINRLKCFVCIGIGNAYEAIDTVWVSYKEACDALKYRFIVGKNQVMSYSDICSVQEEQTHIENDLMNSFCFYLKSGLKDKAEELINCVFKDVCSGVNCIAQVRVFACNFVANILNVLMETGIKPEEIFEGVTQPFEDVFKLDSLPETKNYLNDISFKVIAKIHSAQGKKARKVIHDVKDYIDSNYTRPDITLSEVAKNFYLNLSYLSRIFKEETGMTFVDYLNKLRMEKAIKLLNETDKKAYEIAEEVGINDPHYFSVCFKKFSGVSVNEFKKAR
ncbi:MAG: response regulator [Clostridia bacterium]|nr:response regulator [Clostridia bacterium]